MNTNFINYKKTFYPLILSIILCSKYSSATVGSISGELLQNNPILNSPLPPISGGLNENNNSTPEMARSEINTTHSSPRVKINHINVVDGPRSTEKEIKALTHKYNARYLSLQDLQSIAIEITSLLQQHGERLSYAYIPDQKINNGVVIIKVMTGYIEKINLSKNESLLKNSTIEKYTSKLLNHKSGAVQIDKQLLILSDLPGIGDVSPYLSAGSEDGGSILNMDIGSSPMINGNLVFDNAGSISSGRDRIGTQVNFNSPLGYGDRLQALVYVSPDFLQINNASRHGNTFISRVSYDAPILTDGARGGVSFSRVNYTLGGPILHGLGDGFADVTSFYGSYPLIRTNASSSVLGFNFDFKNMNDKFWGESNKRSSSLFAVQLTGNISSSFFDKPNMFQYELSPSIGFLKNSDEWNGLSTKGTFHKINYNFKFQQALNSWLIFQLISNGQQSSKNLDGAEKMTLGGPYAVRAYSNSSVSVDKGWVISPSLIMPVYGIDGLTTEVFYDYASGKIQKFSKGPNTVDIRGYGISLNYDLTSNLYINTSYAWRDGHEKLLQSQNKTMGWITAGYRF